MAELTGLSVIICAFVSCLSLIGCRWGENWCTAVPKRDHELRVSSQGSQGNLRTPHSRQGASVSSLCANQCVLPA